MSKGVPVRMDQPPNAALHGEELVRVLVVDDHSLISETLRHVLTEEEGFHVDLAITAKDALEQITDNDKYGVVLLDYDMPDSKGLSLLEKLIAANQGGVALFTGVAGYPIIQKALEMGASGYVPKTTSLRNLKNIIRIIASGETYIPFEFVQKVNSFGKTPFDLKPRELLILNLLGEGLQNKEIGASLDLEETIVKMCVRSICVKLSVRNRTQAVIAGRKSGLL